MAKATNESDLKDLPETAAAAFKRKTQDVIKKLEGKYVLEIHNDMKRNGGGSTSGTFDIHIDASKINDPKELGRIYGEIEAKKYTAALGDATVRMRLREIFLNGSQFPAVPDSVAIVLQRCGVEISDIRHNFSPELVYDTILRDFANRAPRKQL